MGRIEFGGQTEAVFEGAEAAGFRRYLSGNRTQIDDDCWITRFVLFAVARQRSIDYRLALYLDRDRVFATPVRTMGTNGGTHVTEPKEATLAARCPKGAVADWMLYRSSSLDDTNEHIMSLTTNGAPSGRYVNDSGNDRIPPDLPSRVPDNLGAYGSMSYRGFLEYEPNRAPTAGAFTSPDAGALVNSTSVTIAGSTPHGAGDGAFDQTSGVQVQVFVAATDEKVYDETVVPGDAQQADKRFSVSVPLAAERRYYARYRHKDSWAVWSPFTNDRYFSMAAGPDAPTPLSPLVLLDQLTGFSYRFEHNHPEGRAADGFELELRNASGSTVLWSSGVRALSATVATGAPVVFGPSFGAAGHPALQWATGYQWRARVRDSVGAWGPWSALPAGSFRTNSTPDAPEPNIPGENLKTGERNFRVRLSDPDGDAIAAAQLELVRVSTGAAVDLAPNDAGSVYGAMTVQGDAAAFEAPAGAMVAGQQYRYRARATDGKQSGHGPWGAYRSFTFVVAASVSLLSPPEVERTNAVPDPSAERETAYWAPVGNTGGSTWAREETEDAAFGAFRWRMTKAAGTPDLEHRGARIAVDATKNWLARCSAKKVPPQDGSAAPATNATFRLRCLDSSGALLGTVAPGLVLPMNGRDLDPHWRSYGGLVRPAGTAGGSSAHPAFPAGTTHVEPSVLVSGGAQDLALDAFFLEQVPAATDAEWASLRAFHGYVDPGSPSYAPGRYDPGGAYGGSVGVWTGEEENSPSRVLGVLEGLTGNAVQISYSHPGGVAKAQDRLIVDRLKPNGAWERHHDSGWRASASTLIPLPDNLFQNERRYRLSVDVRDANDLPARSAYASFAARYVGPPELAVLSYSDDPSSGTIEIEFEASGLPDAEFGGIEVARECEETGEEMRTVALLTNPNRTRYTYHFPVSGRTYRYHVRQIRLVGPERIEGRYRSIEASVDYAGWNFLKLGRDPSVFVRFQHASGAGPAFPREKPNEGYRPWGAANPVHLFGEGEHRSGTTAFLLYPHPDLPEPRERLKVLKAMRRESGALCLLTNLPDPEKTWIALTGPVTPGNAGRLISVELEWTQTAYVEDAYALLGAYDEETA